MQKYIETAQKVTYWLVKEEEEAAVYNVFNAIHNHLVMVNVIHKLIIIHIVKLIIKANMIYYMGSESLNVI